MTFRLRRTVPFYEMRGLIPGDEPSSSLDNPCYGASWLDLKGPQLYGGNRNLAFFQHQQHAIDH